MRPKRKRRAVAHRERLEAVPAGRPAVDLPAGAGAVEDLVFDEAAVPDEKPRQIAVLPAVEVMLFGSRLGFGRGSGMDARRKGPGIEDEGRIGFPFLPPDRGRYFLDGLAPAVEGKAFFNEDSLGKENPADRLAICRGIAKPKDIFSFLEEIGSGFLVEAGRVFHREAKDEARGLSRHEKGRLAEGHEGLIFLVERHFWSGKI